MLLFSFSELDDMRLAIVASYRHILVQIMNKCVLVTESQGPSELDWEQGSRIRGLVASLKNLFVTTPITSSSLQVHKNVLRRFAELFGELFFL